MKYDIDLLEMQRDALTFRRIKSEGAKTRKKALKTVASKTFFNRFRMLQVERECPLLEAEAVSST